MRLLVCVLFFSLAGCTKSELPESISEMINDQAVTTASGSFVSGPYGMVTGKGKVLKDNDKYQAVLDSFTTSDGPDLYVYLSKEPMPVNFIDLGKLKALSGSQVYEISTQPNLTEYKYLVIHCKSYNHLFGYALLQ